MRRSGHWVLILAASMGLVLALGLTSSQTKAGDRLIELKRAHINHRPPILHIDNDLQDVEPEPEDDSVLGWSEIPGVVMPFNGLSPTRLPTSVVGPEK